MGAPKSIDLDYKLSSKFGIFWVAAKLCTIFFVYWIVLSVLIYGAMRVVLTITGSAGPTLPATCEPCEPCKGPVQ